MSDKKQKHPLGNRKPQGGVVIDPPKPRGGFYTFLLLTGGLAVTGVGAGLAFAKDYSWQLVRVGRYTEAAGIENGSLIVGGLLLFAMGILARKVTLSAAAKMPPVRKDNTMEILSEAMQKDMLQLKTTLFQLSEEISALNKTQEALVRTQAAKEKADAEAGPSDQQNAMFRLAASLDQLGAKLDDRMNGLAQRVEERMEKVGSAVDSARASLEERIANQPSSANPYAAPMPLEATPAPAPVVHLHDTGRTPQFDPTQHHPQQPQASTAPVGFTATPQEDFEVVVDLELEAEEARAAKESEALLHTLDELDNLIGDAKSTQPGQLPPTPSYPTPPTPSGPMPVPPQAAGEPPMPYMPGEGHTPPPAMPPMPDPSSPSDLDALWPEENDPR